MSISHTWQYVESRGEFICQCGIGHYPTWLEGQRHGECPLNCCLSHFFPGRTPTVGDVALCGIGTLGIITVAERQPVSYADGCTGRAWVGYHLTNAQEAVGARWSSRNPCILFNVSSFFAVDNIDWAETLYETARNLRVIGWNYREPRTQTTDAVQRLLKDIVEKYRVAA